MNINDAFPSKHLKASDLKGSAVAVTVSHVDIEEIGQKKDKKMVLYFEGKDKGLVLNKTNSKKISELLGSTETDDWAGQRIAIYPSETEYQGDTVECIRVKTPSKTTGAKPAPKPEPAPVVEDEGQFDPGGDDIPF